MIQPRASHLALLLSILLLSRAASLNAQERQSLAVLDLEGRGVSVQEAATLTDRLRSELVKTGVVTVVELEQMRQVPMKQYFVQPDFTLHERAVEVGRLLRVTSIVAGSIARVGSTIRIEIEVVDVESSRIISRLTYDNKGNFDDLLYEMGSLATSLVKQGVYLEEYLEEPLEAEAPEPSPQAAAPREPLKVPRQLWLPRLAPSYPKFPWPPPQASATEVLPRELLEQPEGPTLLRDVDRRVTEALDENGYYESSYYAVPDGFALVTKLEQINPDGTSKQLEERWILGTKQLKRFSLKQYLRALFKASPGYFRIIVFITTPIPHSQTDERVTREEAIKWFRGGLDRLPPEIGNLDFSEEGYECTALIYEFERPSETDKAVLRFHGYPGRILLEKAGIWGSLTQ